MRQTEREEGKMDKTRRKLKIFTLTFWEDLGLWKKKLDENVPQLYGDLAAVTSFLPLVLFLRMIIVNVLCNVITKLQYDLHLTHTSAQIVTSSAQISQFPVHSYFLTSFSLTALPVSEDYSYLPQPWTQFETSFSVFHTFPFTFQRYSSHFFPCLISWTFSVQVQDFSKYQK